MSRPRTIPDRGDIPASLVAARLGLSLADFELRLDALLARGFPAADPTTGCYSIEAVDRWRCLRHPRLFPELTGAQSAVNAAAVFEKRLGQLNG